MVALVCLACVAPRNDRCSKVRADFFPFVMALLQLGPVRLPFVALGAANVKQGLCPKVQIVGRCPSLKLICCVKVPDALESQARDACCPMH